MPHSRRVVPPPVIFLTFVVIGAVIHRRWPLPIADYEFRLGLFAGIAVIVVAAALAAWAITVVLRHGTTVEPDRDPTRLVTSGPFRFTRNPMYLGMLLISLALAVMVNSMWMLGTALLFMLVIDRYIIAGEERVMGAIFGEDYAAYRRRVRRWL